MKDLEEKEWRECKIDLRAAGEMEHCSFMDNKHQFEESTLARLYLEISQRTSARTRRENDALGIMKRVWLKLHCGVDHEPDSKIADAAWDWICDSMGVDDAIKWSEDVIKD